MKQTRTLTFAVLLTLLCIPALSRAQQTLTVYNGTETSDHVPAYIYYWDDFTRSQFVIPADSLTAMDGGTISALTFYTNESNVPFSSLSTVDVYLKEVSGTTLSDFVSKSSATVVYSGTIDIEATGSGGQMTITFSTPYSYSGGNLLVGIENTTDMGYRNIYFYGKTVTGASGAGSDPNSLDNVTFQQQNFIPTTTFTFTNWEFGDTMAYCGVNANVDNSSVFGMQYCDAAAVKYPASMMAGRNYLRSLFFYIPSYSSTSDFTIHICQEVVDGEPQIDASVFTNTYSISEFSPGWVELPTPGCQLDDSKPLWVIINIDGMPYVETDIREGNAQIVHWTSTDKWKPVYDGQNSSYASYSNLMWPLYAVTSATEPVYTDCSVALDLPFTCGFEPSDNLDCWTFIDADGDGYGWYSDDGYGCSDSYNSHAGSLTPDNWLITPRLHIPAEGATLEWWCRSLALIDVAEHYSVLVSTTGTETSDFTGNIFEATLTTDEGMQRSVSLAAYAGQDVYIAFRHHDCTDQFIFYIDDISVTAGTEGIDNPQYSSLNSRLSIFPNPTSGVVTLRAEALREVSILDLNGRTVANHQFVISNPGIQNSEFTIDLSDLPAGLYLLRIVTDNGVTMQKILKE